MHFYNMIKTLSQLHPIALHLLPHVLLYQDSELVDE